jgi:kumamolisin
MIVTAVHPYFKKALLTPSALHARATGSGPWAVPDLCAAYQWPTGLAGGGVIAIVELGGGWTRNDMTSYFASIKQPLPGITDISVDGTVNSPGQDADGEVALDIQVAAAAYYAATGKPATIRVYWAADIAIAVRAATKDGCDVCSISWGADEANWGKAAADDMEAAAQEAARAGMMVFAASGDNDSSDGGTTAANVDLPAGCPHVIGCGGTNKTRSSEVVWNDAPGSASGDGTGGGYSTLFAMPTWQIGLAPAGTGRMVPDVAACADPNTGYQIYYQGGPQVIGGTSAVSPLYSGLFAAFGKKLGFISDKLWANAGTFADVTSGDNGMFHAQVGPDPCTGLGVPIGRKIDGIFMAVAPAPQPGPAPIAPVVTLAEATAWAIADLPRTFMTRQMAVAFVTRSLKKHWPAGTP